VSGGSVFNNLGTMAGKMINRNDFYKVGRVQITLGIIVLKRLKNNGI